MLGEWASPRVGRHREVGKYPLMVVSYFLSLVDPRRCHQAADEDTQGIPKPRVQAQRPARPADGFVEGPVQIVVLGQQAIIEKRLLADGRQSDRVFGAIDALRGITDEAEGPTAEHPGPRIVGRYGQCPLEEGQRLVVVSLEHRAAMSLDGQRQAVAGVAVDSTL